MFDAETGPEAATLPTASEPVVETLPADSAPTERNVRQSQVEERTLNDKRRIHHQAPGRRAGDRRVGVLTKRKTSSIILNSALVTRSRKVTNLNLDNGNRRQGGGHE